jgi:hypothetical protein
MDLPGPEAYPPLPGLEPRALRRPGACRKCRSGTAVAYVRAGAGWPCCIRCAERAAKIPCPHCGDTTPPESRSWYQLPEGGGQIGIRHESGAICYPLDVRARYRLPCSSCGGELRFLVIACDAVIRGGVTHELACACGARWKLEGTAAVRVYLGAA